MAAGGRRKTDSLQYKATVGIISTIIGTMIGLGSFFLGQMARAEEDGYKAGVQNSKIEDNTKGVNLLSGEIKEVKLEQKEIKTKVHAIDKNIVKVGTKIDFLIKKEKEREE
jgi:hypothetical protein